MQFSPTQDFACEELRSEYVTGLVYTIKPGNDVLAKHATQWLAEGKVKLVSGPKPVAQVKGAGVVK